MLSKREFWLYQEDQTKPYEVFVNKSNAERQKESDGGDGIIIHVIEVTEP